MQLHVFLLTGMDPVLCVEANFLAHATCFLRLGDTLVIPVMNHYGAMHRVLYLCHHKLCMFTDDAIYDFYQVRVVVYQKHVIVQYLATAMTTAIVKYLTLWLELYFTIVSRPSSLTKQCLF
jgi:hypothetical protein